jgi:RNA polymerase sigma-70 factor (ECF subfamily)
MNPAEPSIPPDAQFATTHWSVVLKAARPDAPEALSALTKLCRQYWFPLYAYARRHGCEVPAAQDLTQGFFARLLEKNYLGVADRKRGRFRWFLLTAFKCYLANEWDRSQALKRGGGTEIVSFDGMAAETRYQLELGRSTDAGEDWLFDQRWAMDLLAQARTRLRSEYETSGRTERFTRLAAYLPGGQSTLTQAELGRELGLTEGTVKQEVFRLRRRYGELLRQAVAQTVAHPDDIEDEIRYLIDVVSRAG